MKRIIFVFVLILFATLFANAQDTVKYWNYGGFATITFNQMGLSNWTKGGENSLSLSGLMNLYAKYKKSDFEWENTLDLGYGLLQNDEDKIRKTDDKIDFNSKLGYKAVENLFYTALLNFKSQFTEGFKYPNDSVSVSNFLAPGYLIASVGMDFKASKYFSIYFSPATGRFIFVNDQRLADSAIYGNVKGEKFKADFGAYLTTQVQLSLMENVDFKSKLDLFNNYTDKNEGNRSNIDVNWESSIVMKVNSFITANIFTHLIYDHDTKVPIYENINNVKAKIGEGPRTQFKEVLGIGLSYKF